MLFGWILFSLPFFVEQLVEMIIDNEIVTINCTLQEHNNIPKQQGYCAFVLGVLILLHVGFLVFCS